MKPSLNFADRLRFFPMRFFSEKRLQSWFWKKAGNQESTFSHSFSLLHQKNHLVFLPDDIRLLKVFSPFLQNLTSSNNLYVASRNMEPIPFRLSGEIFYGLSPNFRYGEPLFSDLEAEVMKRKFECSLYLKEDFFLPFLYLAKKSKSSYRVGFNNSLPFSFLNISLMAETPKTQLQLLESQYQTSCR